MKKIVTRQNNFIYLFVALFSILFLTSWNQELPSEAAKILFRISIVSMLLIGVLSLKTRRSWVWVVLALAAFNLLLFVLDAKFETIATTLSQLLIWFIFFTGSFWLSVRQIVESSIVDFNMMIGSIVLYLLLGLTWTTLYILILMFFPDALHGIAPDGDMHNILPQIIYYSFVTLTTLGYGDISANNGIAQFLAYTEAIAGVFYIAVIVSTLVSARIETVRNSNQELKS